MLVSLVGVGHERRIVFRPPLEGHRQFAAGAELAEEHIGQSAAALLSAIPCPDEAFQLWLPVAALYVAAGIDHTDGRHTAAGNQLHQFLALSLKGKRAVAALRFEVLVESLAGDDEVVGTHLLADALFPFGVNPAQAKLDVGQSALLIVFYLGTIHPSGLQPLLLLAPSGGPVVPVVDDAFAVNAESESIVATHHEDVVASFSDADPRLIASRERSLGIHFLDGACHPRRLQLSFRPAGERRSFHYLIVIIGGGEPLLLQFRIGKATLFGHVGVDFRIEQVELDAPLAASLAQPVVGRRAAEGHDVTASAAIDILAGVVSCQADALHSGADGQDAILVLQQHEALCRHVVGCLGALSVV